MPRPVLGVNDSHEEQSIPLDQRLIGSFTRVIGIGISGINKDMAALD